MRAAMHAATHAAMHAAMAPVAPVAPVAPLALQGVAQPVVGVSAAPSGCMRVEYTDRLGVNRENCFVQAHVISV